MGITFLITFREGIEIALIMAIVFGYLAHTGRRDLYRAAWRGMLAAGALCAAAGIATFAWIGSLSDRAGEGVEGVIMVLAAAVLTYMVVWMRQHAPTLKARLHGEMGRASTPIAIGVFAAAVVLREGFETVMFLLSASSQASSGSVVVIGAGAGLTVSAVAGWLLYSRSLRINLHRYFQVTGIALIMFAAGSLAYGVHELREFVGYHGPLSGTAWSIDAGPLAGGVLADLLGIFGWDADPEWMRVITYLGYAAVMLTWFQRPSPARRTAAPALARRGELPLEQGKLRVNSIQEPQLGDRHMSAGRGTEHAVESGQIA